MPRKSVASLSVVPCVPGKGRPEPPADLDALESRIWREVVDALPGHWLDTAGQLIFRRLAAQAAVSERQEARLRQLRAQDEDDDEEAAILASQHGVMAKNVAYLLTQLRATPRAQSVLAHGRSRLLKLDRGRFGPVPRRKSKQVADDKVTAADVIAFIERTCFIPEGKFVGRQLKLFDWQKDLLRLIYDNPQGTRRAIVSMGRKGGKTSLSACLLLAHLCGPPARNKPNSQLYSAAQSRDQAAHYLFIGGEDGPPESAAGAGRDHSGDRKITNLSGAGDPISGFERRRHHGLWAFSTVGHSRRAWPRSRPAVAVVRSLGDRDRRSGKSALDPSAV